MPELDAKTESTLKQTLADVDALRERMLTLHRETQYEDLEHGAVALEIVHHTIEEVLEHTGLGGHISGAADAAAHRQAEGWKTTVAEIRAEAGQLLKTHDNEDLETAIKALTIAEGSLEEVAEKYE